MKGRPSLFEVMSKAPETSETVPRNRGKWWQRTDGGTAQGPVQIVAEALTEEEAAEELAAQANAVAEASREQDQRDADRRARREVRRTQLAEMRATATEFVRSRLALGEAAPIVERSGDRFVVSVNLAGSLIAAALLCIVFVGVYLAGHRAGSNATGKPLVEVAALTKSNDSGERGNRRPMHVAGQPSNRFGGSPDLSAIAPPLNRPRREERRGVRANQPATVANGAPEQGLSAERLNYLEIQWFEISGGRESAVLKDVREVQTFLADNGIETVARRVNGGVRLYSRGGFPMDAESRTQRQAFRKAVAEYGRAYRRQGGRYEWTDCFFVSYGRATAGDPV